jgi:protein O-GlcNAc transferase
MDNFEKAGQQLINGANLLSRKKIDASILAFKRAIFYDPKMAGAYFNLGLAYQVQNNLPEAVKNFKIAVKLNPKDFEALNLLGHSYNLWRKPEEAFKCFKKSVSIKPDYAPALTNLGYSYMKLGKVNRALNCYQKSIESDPNYATAYNFLGNALLAQGNINDAILFYKMAIEKNKTDSEVYNNLGVAYARQQKYDDAFVAFKKAINLDKDGKEALENLAIIYTASEKNAAGISYLKRAFERFSDDGVVASNLYHEMRHVGQWEEAAKLKVRLDKITDNDIALGLPPGEVAFINIVHNADPQRNLTIARLWSNSLAKNLDISKKFTFEKPDNIGKRKIKIGYFSAHFHNHPTSHLIAKLLEIHDRSKFEIYIYSTGPGDGSTYFERIKKSCDCFVNLFSTNLSNCAIEINKDKIDILIDLDGYTDNHRLQVFALRPAPIQVSYLGFPGSTGADFIDYIIADKVVIPPPFQKYFSEKVVYLPGSYQVNDDSQKISSKKYTKKFFRIPEKSFVYTSFNSTYKIESQVFEIWMNILRKVPNSVLWLLKNGSLAKTNLQKEAQRQGINPNRLIFSPRLEKDKHLSRLALANLALDTFTCNGHTTTSDCLWAGVPVITLLGSHFASRVSGSLLTTIGLPELITKTPEEYEDLAVYFANNPKKLASIRYTLHANRLTTPLFDTHKFTKNLEKAYQKMWEIYCFGKKPRNINIED